MLPPGQKARVDFPRFGLPAYANRFPTNAIERTIRVEVNQNGAIVVDISSPDLPRSKMQSDFHCVTTWSYIDAKWEGVRFMDFYEHHVLPLIAEDSHISGAVLYAQDGYKTTVLLEDLLVENVLLADTLDEQPLSIKHGAPLRLVAPEHYGYKNLKHLSRIEFYETIPVVKKGCRAFLDHPRARVKAEERGRWVPGWILRYIYRQLISSTVKNFRKAMDLYTSGSS